MTLKSKLGTDNLVRSLCLALRAELPGDIAAFNALEGVQVLVPLRGPFTFSAEATLTFTLAGDAFTAASVTATIPAATYTAAALITLLNADTSFKTELVASAIGYQQVLIESKTLGTVGRITTSANTVLGLTAGSQYSYTPLASLNYVKVAHKEFMTPVLPCCLVWPSSMAVDMDEYSATIGITVRVTAPYASADFVHPIAFQLMRYCEIIEKLIKSETTCGGHVMRFRVNSINYSPDLFVADENENQLIAEATIQVTALTEEEPS